MLSNKIDWALANPKWAAELNPFLSNPLNDVSILKNVVLMTGTNVINHLLGRVQQGWFVLDINGAVTIYRSAPFNNLTLSLSSSGNVTVSIGVF